MIFVSVVSGERSELPGRRQEAGPFSQSAVK
jgi:hypothetical protein